MKPKADLQESLYGLPYHYLAGFDERGAFYLQRKINWGLEYMTYTTFVAGLINKLAPRSLLDVGCGDGRLTAEVEGSVPVVRGIDRSAAAIQWARILNPRVDYVRGELADETRGYDMVTAIEVLEHIADADLPEFVRGLARCASPSGRLVVSVPTVRVPLSAKHYRHYTLERLRETLAKSFRIETSWWLYRRSAVEWMIRNALCNRLFTLNPCGLRRALWTLHERVTYYATAANGAHLVCLAAVDDPEQTGG